MSRRKLVDLSEDISAGLTVTAVAVGWRAVVAAVRCKPESFGLSRSLDIADKRPAVAVAAAVAAVELEVAAVAVVGASASEAAAARSSLTAVECLSSASLELPAAACCSLAAFDSDSSWSICPAAADSCSCPSS